MVSVCAWCERFLGLKEPKTDPTITHGICKACLARQTWEDAPVLVVSRDREELLPALEEMLRGIPEIRLVVDRRRTDRRNKNTQPGGPALPERRQRPARLGDALMLR